MADMMMNVATEVAVEFSVGDKTAAWLESLGWARPVEVEAGSGSDIVETGSAPSSSVEEAKVALDGREANRLMAQQLRDTLMTELSSPERVDELLMLCGVQMDKLLQPVLPAVSTASDGVVDAAADA